MCSGLLGECLMRNILVWGNDTRIISLVGSIAKEYSFSIKTFDDTPFFYPDSRKCDYSKLSLCNLNLGPYFPRLMNAMYRDAKLSWRHLDVDATYWYFAMKEKFSRYIAETDCVLFSNVPHEGLDLIIAELAEENGKKWFAPLQAAVEPYAFQLVSNGFVHLKSHEPIFVQPRKNKSVGLRYQKKNIDVNLEFQKTKKKSFSVDRLINYLYRKQKNNVNLETVIDEDREQKRGIIALHMQPELTTEPLAFEYANPIVWIETLLNTYKSVYWIIREHPDPSARFRGKYFQKYLEDGIRCERFGFLSQRDSLNLDCFDIVSTLNGTIGLEALSNNKTVVCDKSAFYRDMEGAYTIGELLPEISSNKILKNQSQRETVNLFQGLVDPYYLNTKDNSELYQGWVNLLRIISV